MDAVAPLLLAGCLVVLPGLASLLIVRARSPFVIGYAPPVSCLMLLVASAVLSGLGIDWRLEPVLVVLAVMVLALGAGALVSGRLARHARPSRAGRAGRRDGARPGARDVVARAVDPDIDPADPHALDEARRRRRRRGRIAAAVLPLGALAGSAAVVVPALAGMGGVGTLNGSYDAFFHYSALAFIRADGDAFPLTALAPMYGGAEAYYPTTWHMVAALLPGDVVTAANAAVLVTLALVAPSTAALLHTVVPRRRDPLPRALAITAITCSSALFLSLPVTALGFGLWPFAFAVALLPAAVGALAELLHRGEVGLRRRGAAALVICGTASVHPSILITLAVVMGAIALIGALALLEMRGRRVIGATALAVLLVGGVGIIRVVIAHLAPMAELTHQEPTNALTPLLVLLGDRPRVRALPYEPLFMVPLLALAAVGAVRAVLLRSRALLVALVCAVIAVVLTYATQSHVPAVRALSAPWYGARERIAPLFAMSVMVLACGGLLWRPHGRTGGMSERTSRLVIAVVATVLVATTVLGAAVPTRVRLVGSLAYGAWGLHLQPYVTGPERAFIERAAAELPPGAVVLGDPRDGTSLFWALGGVDVVYPSLAGPQTLDGRRVARYGDDYRTDPKVCTSLTDLHAAYLYRDESARDGDYFGTPEENLLWQGLRTMPADDLQVVDRSGDYVLYRLVLPC